MSKLLPSQRKWLASILIVMISARLLDMTDGFTTVSPSAHQSEETESEHHEQSLNGDFLAMSDVYIAPSDNSSSSSSFSDYKNFWVSKSELTGICENGECTGGSGGDVLRVVSKLAKSILSDPRILGLRTGLPDEPNDEESESESGRAVGGGTNFDTRPFTSSDYYYNNDGNYRNREGASDNYAVASNTGSNYRNRDRGYVNEATSSEGYYGGQVASSAYDRDGGYGGGGYEEESYDSYSGGGGGYHPPEKCCENNKLFPIFLVGLLGLLAFFLYLRSTTTTSATGRRFGFEDVDVNEGKNDKQNLNNLLPFLFLFPLYL